MEGRRTVTVKSLTAVGKCRASIGLPYSDRRGGLAAQTEAPPPCPKWVKDWRDGEGDLSVGGQKSSTNGLVM